MSQIQFFADNINIYNNLNIDSSSTLGVFLIALSIIVLRVNYFYTSKKNEKCVLAFR